MRQLTYVEPGQVEWQEVAEPTLPDSRSALVRPLAVARCDLDLPMAAFGIFPGPFPVGHETVAEVIAIGDDVTGHAVGDMVLVPFQVSCGSCVACHDRRFAACHPFRAKAGAAFGFGVAGGGHGGALADLLAVPAADHLLMAAPIGLSPRALCTLPDNVVDAYRTVGPALGDRSGADVLVVGGTAASIGLYAVAIAVALGSEHVRYVDDDSDRCRVADALGADVVQHSGGWPRRFERATITVDNTGDAEGLATVLRSTDDYGTCTPVAIHFTPTTPIPMLEMYTRGVTLHISRADSRRYLPEVVELAAAGRFDPLEVPTTVVGWDEAAEAWLSPSIKLVVERPTG